MDQTDSQSKPSRSSLNRRFFRLLWASPGTARTLLRELWRQKAGINLDRRRRHGLSSPPVNLNLNLTRRCNLKCRMCEQHRHQAGTAAELSWYDPQRELSLAVWTGLLDQVAAFKPRLYLTGGEPMLYRHFPEFVTAAKERGFLVHLQTNGTLLAGLGDFLVDQGLEMVTVSLDGPQEVHDRVRGQNGAFRRTTAGIASLVAARRRKNRPGPILILNCVISRANLQVLEEMPALAQELGADVLQLQHTMFNAAANVRRHNLALTPDFARKHGLELVAPSIPEGEFYESEITAADLPRLRSALRRARVAAQGRLKLDFLPGLPEELIGPYYLDLAYPFPQVCDALWKGCRILPDGTVSPCLHVVAGNISRQSFPEIWNGPQMQNFRRLLARRLFPGCARCCSRRFIR
jgi:MoaA/NifB/PqqE/SkfB family radical SAM enzyme